MDNSKLIIEQAILRSLAEQNLISNEELYIAIEYLNKIQKKNRDG